MRDILSDLAQEILMITPMIKIFFSEENNSVCSAKVNFLLYNCVINSVKFCFHVSNQKQVKNKPLNNIV